MKLFSQYLAEAEDAEKKGTFGALHLTKKSRERIYKAVSKMGIEGLIEADEYHCTIVYSTKPVPQVKDIPVEFPFRSTIKEWKVLGDSKMLVMVLNAPEAVDLFEKTIEMGAKTDYPEFIPHISVAKNYKADLPTETPDFQVVFDKFNVGPLDEDFSYTEDDDK